MLFKYPSESTTSTEKLEQYERNVQRDFDLIEKWLPSQLISMIDIGCSMGGIDILIAHAKSSLSVINLIDGDGTAPKRGGYHEELEPWNDVREALDFVSLNTKCSIRAFTPATVPPRIAVDFIISFKSWCHHYSVNVYKDLAKNSLSSKGRMILDIRKGHEDSTFDAFYQVGFNPLDTIYETPKCYRVVFEKIC